MIEINSDGDEKQFFELLNDISKNYEYWGVGFSVSEKSDSTIDYLDEEDMKDSPLVRMIQIVLNEVISEGV
jgi:hypothetical protein